MRDTLSMARFLLRQRKFKEAIRTLHSRAEFYVDNFDYFLLLGTAYLYFGDSGSAWENFELARKIKMTDTTLLLGQAAIYLRRGDTASAIGYYLEILEYDPNHKAAHDALEFVRNSEGDYNTICTWADSGKLEKFYPPIGVNYLRIVKFSLAGCAVLFVLIFVLKAFVFVKPNIKTVGRRGDLSSIEFSNSELRNAQLEASPGAVRYNLTNRQITESVRLAFEYWQNYRDNAAIIEVNRINGSNANDIIKQKVSNILGYMTEPTLESVVDVPEYSQVINDPFLYAGCYVAWEGFIVNSRTEADGYNADLLMTLSDAGRTTFSVPIHFDGAPVVDYNRTAKILAKITLDGGKLTLEGRSLFQSIRDAFVMPQN